MYRRQRVTDLKLDEPTVVVACATCSVSRGSAVPSAVLTHLRQAWEYMDGHRKTKAPATATKGNEWYRGVVE